LNDVNAKYSGEGIIEIYNIKIPVTFINVMMKKSSDQKYFVAIAGKVKGKTHSFREKKYIKYTLDGFIIQAITQSIDITTKYAVASVSVKQDSPVFYTDTVNNLFLESRSCNIEPNGAIEGANFQGSSSFDLKDSVYQRLLIFSDH
jgi:hypothetical protein